MLKDIFVKTELYKQVIIFGAGKIGLTIYNSLKKLYENKNIDFCDNAEYLQGNFYDYSVYSVSEATSVFPNALYITSGMYCSDAMKKQLMDNGIVEDNIIFGATEEIIEEKNRHYNYVDDRDRTIPLKRLRFEIDCTEHCNLNCIGCSVFASLSKPVFLNVKELEKDLKRMSEIFHKECEYIYLIGGEPLLHPELTNIMELARGYFPIGEISVFTNGTLIMKQNEMFWEICRKKDIRFIITKYPISIDYKVFENKLNSERIAWSWAFSDDSIKFMESSNIDLKGAQIPENSFRHCYEGNNCIKLKNGRLYTCNVVANIYKFNKAFKKKLEVTKDDYIDIFSDITGDEILTQLAKPIPFCRYCNKAKASRKFKWQVSNNRIEEWLSD